MMSLVETKYNFSPKLQVGAVAQHQQPMSIVDHYLKPSMTSTLPSVPLLFKG